MFLFGIVFQMPYNFGELDGRICDQVCENVKKMEADEKSLNNYCTEKLITTPSAKIVAMKKKCDKGLLKILHVRTNQHNIFFLLYKYNFYFSLYCMQSS